MNQGEDRQALYYYMYVNGVIKHFRDVCSTEILQISNFNVFETTRVFYNNNNNGTLGHLR